MKSEVKGQNYMKFHKRQYGIKSAVTSLFVRIENSNLLHSMITICGLKYIVHI